MDTMYMAKGELSLPMDTVLLLHLRTGTMFMVMSSPLDMLSTSLTLDFPALTSSAPSFILDMEREVLNLPMYMVLLLLSRTGTMFMDMSWPLDMPLTNLTLDFPPLTSSALSFTLDMEREVLNLHTDTVLLLLW